LIKYNVVVSFRHDLPN